MATARWWIGAWPGLAVELGVGEDDLAVAPAPWVGVQEMTRSKASLTSRATATELPRLMVPESKMTCWSAKTWHLDCRRSRSRPTGRWSTAAGCHGVRG